MRSEYIYLGEILDLVFRCRCRCRLVSVLHSAFICPHQVLSLIPSASQQNIDPHDTQYTGTLQRFSSIPTVQFAFLPPSVCGEQRGATAPLEHDWLTAQIRNARSPWRTAEQQLRLHLSTLSCFCFFFLFFLLSNQCCLFPDK